MNGFPLQVLAFYQVQLVIPVSLSSVKNVVA